MEEIEEHQSYFSVIPDPVLYSKELSDGEKITFAVVSSMTKKRGYCWATNATLAEMLNVQPGAVTRRLSKLQAKGFIRLEVIRGETGEVKERRIWPNFNPVKKDTPLPAQKPIPLPAEKPIPPGSKAEENYANLPKDIPPYPPDGGKATDWLKEAFSQFWDVYPRPRRGGRSDVEKRFIRAVKAEQADSAKVSHWMDVLGAQIRQYDKAYHGVEGENYGRFRLAKTWINQKGWEDETALESEARKKAPPPRQKVPEGKREEFTDASGERKVRYV